MSIISGAAGRLSANPALRAMRVPDDATSTVRAGIAVIAVFFGGLGTWSALAPIAGAAVAPALVKVEGNRQSLQHRDGGIVKQLLVKEGVRVTRGQVLLRLDDTAARAKLDTLIATSDALQTLESRLTAERDGKDEPAFDPALTARRDEPAVAAAMANQSAVFETRRRQFTTEIAIQKQKAAQLREQIAGSQSEIEGVDRQLALIGEELGDTRGLYEKGYAPKTKVLALERAEAKLIADRGALRSSIAKAEQAIGEAELTIERTEHARASEVTDGLRDTQAKLTELAPQIQAARDVVARTDLTAPAAGEVVGLTIFTEGGVVAAGSRVLDIVPSGGALIVEGRVRPQDINDVTVGAPAEVRLTGLIGRKRPALTGTVETLSADRLSDERNGEPYYAAQIRVDPPSLAKSDVTLQPGMPADVLIATRSRSVLEYLISPLSDEIARGFREN
jgi:HlyD family secretion protein/epimerase transport system membrane fusion protein